MIGLPDATGRNPGPEPPGQLELALGMPFSTYRVFSPGDAHYEAFADAWRLQRGWNDDTHVTFWRLGLLLWPRENGQPNRRELYAWWVWSGRRDGQSDTEIAARIGVERDTLRHNGALSMADEFAAADPGWPRRWERVPLIVAVERGETVPTIWEAWYDPRLTPSLPQSMHNLRLDSSAIANRRPKDPRSKRLGRPN